ncbi:MAG: ABC transporter ATP-binding protein [Candidatus Fermentibacteraceae bacterium]|nr:ABC transporter ATP-binding protein [Candidatus Fermentibacteraceae bacterium]
MAAASSTFLQIENISKHYGDIQALKNVSFNIHQGEILGLIGPNGSGKTTLLEGITALMPVNNGKVYKHGSLLNPGNRRDEIFYLPDGILPYRDMPVSVALEFFRNLYGTETKQMNRIIGQLELGSVLHKKVRTLSKGYNRRYLLGIALLSSQPLLILDEPFDGLDLRQMLGVVHILQSVCSSGRSLLLSIHQLADAQRICHRFILLDEGRLLGRGTLDELRLQAGLSDGGLEEVFLALT